MIRVTVEILPFGDEARRRTIASMDIWNDGSGTIENGNYEGIIYTDDSSVFRRARVVNYSRLTHPVWSLVGTFLRLFGHAEPPAATSTVVDPVPAEFPVRPRRSGNHERGM